MKSLVQFFEENVEKYSDNPYMWENGMVHSVPPPMRKCENWFTSLQPD